MRKYSKKEFQEFLKELEEYSTKLNDFQEAGIEFMIDDLPATIEVQESFYPERYSSMSTETSEKYNIRAKKLNYKKIVYSDIPNIVFNKNIKNIDIIYEIYNNYNKYIYRHEIYDGILGGIKKLEEFEEKRVEKLDKKTNLTLKQYVATLSNADKKTLKKLLI